MKMNISYNLNCGGCTLNHRVWSLEYFLGNFISLAKTLSNLKSWTPALFNLNALVYDESCCFRLCEFEKGTKAILCG